MNKNISILIAHLSYGDLFYLTYCQFPVFDMMYDSNKTPIGFRCEQGDSFICFYFTDSYFCWSKFVLYSKEPSPFTK